MEKKSVINLKRIMGLRAEHGETQSDVAKVLNISVTTYQNREWGLSDFKASELIALAEHWGVDVKELLLP